MTMSRKRNSVQKLIGFDIFTKYGIKTDRADFIFFSVEPVNISVLSAANIESKIYHLTMILSVIPELELLALDSCESFEPNKAYVQKRLILLYLSNSKPARKKNFMNYNQMCRWS